jgi:Leucine-rich repeat (LRR) protein
MGYMNRKAAIIPIVLLVLIAFGAGYLIHGHGNKDQNNQTSQVTSTSVNNSKSLDLSGQQLTALAASVTNQTDLTSLNISNNQLTTLPPAIGNLANLEVLNVENNRLQTIPAEIGQLKHLVSADFSNNRLTSLPPELGSLTQLKTLNLAGYKGSSSDIDQLKTQLPNTDIKSK